MRLRRFILVALLLVVATSCASLKDITYFQGVENAVVPQSPSEYEARIKRDDQLTIVVSGADQLVVQPFNLSAPSSSSSNLNLNSPGTGSIRTGNNGTLLGYIVDKNGDIDFPILGKIHVVGLSRMELRDILIDKLKVYIKDPSVYIAFLNYDITVLGEVNNVGVYTMTDERVSIFEIIAEAGDIKVNGDRNNVQLIREGDDGAHTCVELDLTSADIFSSPYYYLQQNDIVYVKPTGRTVAEAQGLNAVGFWSLFLSSFSSILSIIAVTR